MTDDAVGCFGRQLDGTVEKSPVVTACEWLSCRIYPQTSWRHCESLKTAPVLVLDHNRPRSHVHRDEVPTKREVVGLPISVASDLGDHALPSKVRTGGENRRRGQLFGDELARARPEESEGRRVRFSARSRHPLPVPTSIRHRSIRELFG